MKCNGCGADLRKQHPVIIEEPGKPLARYCLKCWHKMMRHPASAIPEGQGDD